MSKNSVPQPMIWGPIVGRYRMGGSQF